jgi:hypothetical protein
MVLNPQSLNWGLYLQSVSWLVMKYKSFGFCYVALTAISEWSHAFNTGVTVQEKTVLFGYDVEHEPC